MLKQGKNNITIILFIVYMVLLIGIILFKLPFYSAEFSTGMRIINLLPFQGSFDGSGVLYLREIINNILLFIPMGIYIRMIKSEWTFLKSLLVIVGVSFIFELIQFVFALGVADITDIIDNTLGGIIGLIISVVFFKVVKTKAATILNLFALIATTIATARFVYIFYLSYFVMGPPPL